MNKLTGFVFSFVLLFTGFFYFAVNINAAEFSQAYVRLDSTKAGAALSGVVCAKPSSAGAGTENKVLVSFPSDFSINSTAGNWATDTSNLPAGATPWPGIGPSATSVSSKTVTFASSDLTSGSALYCFNFTGNSSINPSSAGDDKNANVMTRNSSNAVIDSSDYALSIVDNDQIVVSATVPANPSDFSATISKLTSGTTFGPAEEIEYQITYGSDLSYSTDLTVEASWSLGTIEGDSTPTIEVLDYVSGSASNAYGGAPPIIDTVNRKITWDISSFPPATSGQTVTFKLKTTNTYTGSPKVAFTVSGRLLPPGTSTAYSDSTSYYQYPQTSGGGGASPTPTPTTAPQAKNSIQNVEVQTITDSTAGIFISSSLNSKTTIYYGKSPSALNQSISSSTFSRSTLFNLSRLSSNTKYYFKFSLTDQNGNQISSDIYTFTTSKAAPVSEVSPQSLIATSNDTILSELTPQGQKILQNNLLVVPVNTVFQIKFALKNKTAVKKVQALVRQKQATALITKAGDEKDKKVLGAFVQEVSASTEVIDLVEVEPGVYNGKLKTKNLTGKYEILARIFDLDGNITEQKIADLRVINKFTILQKNDNKPIEGARVMLYIYSQSSKEYVVIPSTSLLSSNPVFTDRFGQLSIALPQGKYKASISSLRFKDQSVLFSIGANDSENFPIVHLEAENRSIFKIIRYYSQTLNDVFIYYTSAYAQVLTGSSRFFDLVSTITLGGLVVLTLFAFSRRHHIPISTMTSYFYYLVDHKNRNEKYIHGVVYDEKDKPIPSANVYIADSINEEIIERVKTNSKGEFFSKKGGKKYLIMVMAKGYKTTPLLAYQEKANLKFKVVLKEKHEGLNLFENIERLISSVIGMSFEGIGILTLLLEMLFINSFGLVRTAPFLVISIFNIALWTLYLHHHHSGRV